MLEKDNTHSHKTHTHTPLTYAAQVVDYELNGSVAKFAKFTKVHFKQHSIIYRVCIFYICISCDLFVGIFVSILESLLIHCDVWLLHLFTVDIRIEKWNSLRHVKDSLDQARFAVGQNFQTILFGWATCIVCVKMCTVSKFFVIIGEIYVTRNAVATLRQVHSQHQYQHQYTHNIQTHKNNQNRNNKK